ncbi:AraC family transcriptional regulator [Paraburkholderia aromaticivorans]|uniref:AraC family transcriptional regulator n=1 Tax=Paraburkholderia aromaticivorans TaxID=2026199 RepID=UPI0014560B89|nr:AraC family transcriptional regulator [Paraburkholderia aromaticivorans]
MAARTALQDRSCAGKSIKEIAFDWGFSDSAHFSHIFNELGGLLEDRWYSETRNWLTYSASNDCPDSSTIFIQHEVTCLRRDP